MKDRIKQIRKEVELNQESFGEKIGLSKSAISNMESGRYNITDTLIITICNVFEINEQWLRTGEGEMFMKRSREEIMAEYAAELTFGDDEFIQNFIKKYMQLSPENKKLFRSLFKE